MVKCVEIDSQGRVNLSRKALLAAVMKLRPTGVAVLAAVTAAIATARNGRRDDGQRFEIVTAYKDRDIHLPIRKTAKSAGYDLEAAETTVLAPHAVTVVPTGLKAFMEGDEYLSIFIRSSLAFKKGLMLANSTGIVDSDYYNNEDNEAIL